jgi:hypothetical protein
MKEMVISDFRSPRIEYISFFYLATFTADRLSSPKPIHVRTKQLSDEYEISTNHHRNSSNENLHKSFVIRRRPISNTNESNLLQSQLFNYDQQLQQNTYDEDDSEDERETNDLSTTILNIQPSAYYNSATHVFQKNLIFICLLN